GPLAKSVALCAAADQVMAAEPPRSVAPSPLSSLTFAVAESYLEGTEPAVLAAFGACLRALELAGAKIVKAELDDLVLAMRTALAEGPIVPVEAAEIHAAHLATQREAFDPQVLARILQGLQVPAPRYVASLNRRRELIAALDARFQDGMVLAMPTTPMVAPRMETVLEPADFQAINARILRNPSFGNFFDLCALSLPMPSDGPPMGLMLLGRHGADAGLLSIARAVEIQLG
ncbi:MAG TPA: amidase family protein, partial [Acidisoma sp.]|nr:amidase family protein [Acidisoma sp.]